MTVGEVLQLPTKIYARALQKILTHYKVKNVVHGIAHVTGGGLLENLERILPANVTATIKRNSWDVLPVFDWIRDLGEIEEDEMDRVFNRGCGLVLVVSPYYATKIQKMLADSELKSWVIGSIQAGEGKAVWQ
jgi:phosphoribosylformylglycinamidine cyclo-ligase